MNLSIILTVFNRPELTLTNTLAALAKNDLSDAEIVIVNDGSTVDYAAFREMLAEWNLPLRWIDADTAERPNAYQIEGHNNPAYVNNLALRAANGDNILWLSSDTILPPHTLTRLKQVDLSKAVWTAKVLDMESGEWFCGPERVMIACWALASSAEAVRAIGGFDEKYIEGMAFEDNDFTGRLALHVGKVLVDGHVTAFHQSHPAVFYSDDGAGYKRSEGYTREKWGGVPWDSRYPVMNMSRSVVGESLIVRCSPGAACKLGAVAHV